MAKKSRDERIRELLHHKERVVFEAKVGATAYVFPVCLAALGIVLMHYPDIILNYVPIRYHGPVEEMLVGAQETFFGYLIAGFGVVVASQIHSARKHNLILVTTQRVIALTGMLFSKRRQIYLHRIGDVKAKQSMFDRLIAKGKVTVKDKVAIHGNEKQKEKHQIVIDSVAHPGQMKKAIFNAVEMYGFRAAQAEEENTKRRMGVAVKVD